METTFEPSLQENVRTKIALIELIELGALAFAFWSFLEVVTIGQAGTSFSEEIIFLLFIEIIVLGSWAIYNAYIRIARAGGRRVDIAIWALASLVTGSYTFWAWSILDTNRFLVSKLLYRGEAPVEYAWSARSKQIRKVWEQGQKTAAV
jgi:hypothetical protein